VATTNPARRRYESPRRRQQAVQTRASVVEAAATMFAERGWAATGMRDIARAAGVSVETLYANFGSKGDLLQAAINVGVVGDSAPVALRDRPEFARLGQGPLTERARSAAHLVAGINARTHGIAKALREAAAGDADLEEQLAAGEERRRRDTNEGLLLVAGRRPTRAERDGLWAVLGTEVYALLVDRAGWSTTQYEAWLADTIARLLAPATKKVTK
jgi:AcrR family transcriptional regulator